MSKKKSNNYDTFIKRRRRLRFVLGLAQVGAYLTLLKYDPEMATLMFLMVLIGELKTETDILNLEDEIKANNSDRLRGDK